MERIALRAVMAAWMVSAIWFPARARAQSDTEELPVLLLHWRVSTSLQLPDEITEVRLLDREQFRFLTLDDMLHIRPQQGTPAGTEALLVVATRTLRRTFLVRVAQHARDVNIDVVVLPGDGPQTIEAATSGLPTVAPMEPPVVPAAPPAPEPEPAPTPAEPAPMSGVEPASERATVASRSRRFELSVHGIVVLAGTTALDVPGYEATYARQPHRVFGMRVTGRRPGSSWGLEVSVSGEWPAAPTVHTKTDRREGDTEIHISGPWLRADAGLRMRYEAPLAPTAYAGIGLQAHHRDVETFNGIGGGRSEAMPFRGVLALGIGLEHRAGNLLLGLELHLRQGVPEDYRSMAALLSVGYVLDQGE
jgi:hypothetical protein